MTTPAAPDSSNPPEVEVTTDHEVKVTTTAAPDSSNPPEVEVTTDQLSTDLHDEEETTTAAQDLHSVSEQEDFALIEEEPLQPSSTMSQETDNNSTYFTAYIHSSPTTTSSPTTSSPITTTTSSPELLLEEPKLRILYSIGETNTSADLRLNECGGRGRIIGGLETAVGAWPWAVVIKDKFDNHFCGGALISSRHILTAAHCIAQ